MTTTTLIAGLLGMAMGYAVTFMMVRRIVKKENTNEQKENPIS